MLSEQQEEKRIKKHRQAKEPLGQLQIYQHLGLEGEEKEQEIENLFEKIMKENFPNLVKETDIQVQEAQSPK